MFLIKDLEVKETPNKGQGVFATANIPAGTVAADYLGKLIKKQDFDEKKHGLYDMDYNDTLLILPDPQKNGAQTLNHSCQPNCDTFSYHGHVLLFALRKIFTGEELTYIYNLEPPTPERCNPCWHICRCGSDFCRGTLHIPEKEYKKLAGSINPEEEEYFKNPPVAVGEELPPLDKYPTSISADAEIYNTLFGFPTKPAQIIKDKILPPLAEIYGQIKESGLRLFLPELNLTVEGILNGHIVIKNGNN